MTKSYKRTLIFVLLILATLIIKFNLISAATTELDDSSCCQIEPSPPRCGDTNGDRDLDESDLSAITSYAFEGVEIPENINVDLNADGIIDVFDVTLMTNYVKRNGAAPRCGVVINEPLVWMCDDRDVIDDEVEPGRYNGRVIYDSEGNYMGFKLDERINNYLFEGEQIHWDVLVYNEKGIENLSNVYVTIGWVRGEGNTPEANCQKTSDVSLESCNARVLEERIEAFDPNTMAYYSCTITVETPDSMYGEYWVTVEAKNNEGYLETMDENEYWYFNPEISLSVEGTVGFENLVPGETSYSNQIKVKNTVEEGSGVIMDMFISGTDFYDSSSSGAYCPEFNRLSLSQFKYFAKNGDYNTSNADGSDEEGYVPIEYGISFNDPFPFYDHAEVIPSAPKGGPYYLPNILAPNKEIDIKFKLNVPRPCSGIFDSGQIYVWGEAI